MLECRQVTRTSTVLNDVVQTAGTLYMDKEMKRKSHVSNVEIDLQKIQIRQRTSMIKNRTDCVHVPDR